MCDGPRHLGPKRFFHRLLVKSDYIVMGRTGGKSGGNDGGTIAYDTRLLVFTLSTGLLPETRGQRRRRPPKLR